MVLHFNKSEKYEQSVNKNMCVKKQTKKIVANGSNPKK